MSEPFFKENGFAASPLASVIPQYQQKLNDRLLFESNEQARLEQEKQAELAKAAAKDPAKAETIIFEAAKRKNQNIREDVFNAVVDWLDNPSYEDFLDKAFELAGLDEIDPVDDAYPDDAADDYFTTLGLMADALVFLGAEPTDVETLVNADEEDDDSVELAEAAIADINAAITDASDLDEESVEDMALIFAASEGDELIMEKMIKVVRKGKVIMKKKRIKPKRMTGKQRAALKKNRRKAWKGQARIKRKKSLKVGRKRGLY